MTEVKYILSFPNRLTHFIHIKMVLRNVNSSSLELILPDWRPGRYELANYVSNVRDFRVYGLEKDVIDFHKTEKNKWILNTKNQSELTVEYRYYANKMDAGSSVIDDEQIYINFINCLYYTQETLNEPSEVSIDIPSDYDWACGLKQNDLGVFMACSYYELVDSPFLASKSLKKLTYKSHEKDFNIVIQGECPLDDRQLISDFKKFTDCQLDQMSGFPAEKFDFIIQSLPYKHYHGVEHRNSTVLVLGPNSNENQSQYYLDLMGVASHELFHVWNVTRIRPQELSPYNFSKENYYETGFVTEGFTTYYGDLFLARSEVFDESQYLNELNIIFKRHFENYGRQHLSLVDSSFDLWIDGYKKLLPGRKVSIYVKGATVAFILDLSIRKESSNKHSLDGLIADLWEEYGKKEVGYTKEDIYRLIRKYLGERGNEFIEKFYQGITPVESELKEMVRYIGCYLIEINHPETTASLFGFRVENKLGALFISEIAPNSTAESRLSIGDYIKGVNGISASKEVLQNLKGTCSLLIERNSKYKTIELEAEESKFFELYEIQRDENASAESKRNFELWMTGKQNHF